MLGAHPVTGAAASSIRVLAPDATRVVSFDDGRTSIARARADGSLRGVSSPARRCRSTIACASSIADGAIWERGDPYRFLPTLGDVDLHLFNEGTHRELWTKLGAHLRTIDGVAGVSFAVWAPNARRVSVVGDFCAWDGRIFPMRMLGSSGVWELFIPDVGAGRALQVRDPHARRRAAPQDRSVRARRWSRRPGTASIVAGRATLSTGATTRG